VRIDGKSVVVTGASSGIGRSLAFVLANRGAVLTLAARRRELLESVALEIVDGRRGGPSPVAVPCDVTVPEQVSALVGGTIERLGAVDVLVNNAGVSVYGAAVRTSLDDYRSVMDVNFFGALNCMHEALPFMMRRESGVIVNVATVAALHGVPYLGAYGASKAALVSLSESLRAELKGTGVRVTVVYPGYTRTAIFETEKNVGGARRPSGRYADPAVVAEAIARGIEAERRDVYLTARGRLLAVLRGAAPGVVERAMERIARDLRETSRGVDGGAR
jgi:short-subunit dehydrogenase